MVCSREIADGKDDLFLSVIKILKHPNYHQYDYVSTDPTKYFLQLTKILIVLVDEPTLSAIAIGRWCCACSQPVHP